MRSHLATKRLSAYIDDELPDRELRRVEAHVSECSACRSRLHGLRLVVSELQRVTAVDTPPSLAASVATEAAMRWGPGGPGAGRVLGRRGVDLLRDMMQLSAVSAGAIAIIASLIAYSASQNAQQASSARVAAPADAVAIAAPERVVAGGRWFVFADGAWLQESLLSGDAAGSSRAMSAEDALLEAPWLVSLLRRGPVVVELSGARQVVDLEWHPAGWRSAVSQSRSSAAE
jgi:anti-sigma factor RsiW